MKEQNQTLQRLLEEHIRTLEKKETLYRQLTEDAEDVLWQTNSQLRITYISPADERLRGFKAEEVLGKHIFEIFTDEGIAIVQEKIQARALAEASGTTTLSSIFEVQHRCKDGRLIWGEVVAKPDRDAQGTIIGYHGITRETTQRKLLQDQVHDLAFYDPLTQLANRRLLIDHLTQALLSCQRQRSQGALLFLDLDNFKSLNDAHGHGAGDLLLIEVAQRLKTCVRAIDTVARFGGDEFVVLLGVLSNEASEAATQAGAIAEKIRASLAQPYQISITPAHQQPPTTVEHRCSASIGLVLFDGNDTVPNQIIDQADAAMYQAKKDGRNRVCVHSTGAGTTETKHGR
ncbi:sensor domain-containing diguanylate cyclase [Simplicispira psychrophila]|uniref:sensor domain-containing diguanylate cyclase n=1 Tax=Simplicispira psychrophila TaxID=80882 RepID=UPI00316AE4D3